MSHDLNHCTFIGRVGKDPETRYLPSGDAVTNFSIACNWKSKDKEGVEWVRVVTFGKLAEICAEYLKKGAQVFISGRMQTRKYEKDGQEHYSTEIVAEKMQMLGSKGGERAEPQARPEPRPAEKPAAGKKGAGSFADMDDDIPFNSIGKGIGGHAI